ncbi:MAG: GGDEF domain-containing protein [Rhodoferax sp.]
MKYFAALIPAIVGTLALLGWLLGIDGLTRIAPNFVAMNPVTALCTMASSAALLISHAPLPYARALRTSLLLSAAAGLCAALKLLEIAFDWQLGVDTWISHAQLDAAAGMPNRMAPNTALILLLLNTAMVCLILGRAVVAAQLMLLLSAALALLAIVGYTYSVASFYGMGQHIPIAVHSATSLLLLAGSALYIRPDRALMAIITNEGPAGRTARMLLPCAILVPIGFGWLRQWGERAGLYSPDFGVALFVMVNVMVFAALIWVNGHVVFTADQHRQRAEEQLRHAATHDKLTGLANRNMFTARLHTRISAAKRYPNRPFAVFYIDLDGFKLVNDRCGHAAGDVLLCDVARLLAQCVRTTDVAARLGGDEFTLLLDEIAGPEDVHVLAQRILTLLPRTFTANACTVPFGASIGIAVYADHRHSLETLLADADTALYQAKRKGKGCYVLHALEGA